ncbi:MAG: YifB family Mg chelatase-like AAA ATPase, partial [Candidatus Uhrbacteria bacterium]
MTKTATVCSATVIGLEGILVDVEADVAAGLPAFSLVGLPDASVKESRDRVRAAIKNCDVAFPRTHVTVNLAPADLRKEGPAFDLPIACAIMLADGKVRFEREDGSQGEARAVRGFDHDTLLIGELGLDGSIRPTIGILPVILAARQRNIQTVILPLGNVDEAAVIDGITLLPVVHLREVIGHLLGAERITPHTRNTNAWTRDATPSTYDFTYIHGLRHAKRALEIAAAGGHNLLFVGPPGTGKSLLAKALPTILPSMTKEEQLEVTLAHSVVGLAPSGGLIRERPFRSPHHSASDIAIIGGGTIPRPGEVTLAHRGVLFMDEFPEFKRSVLEVLRQPLEDGVVTISRAAGTLTFPARFQLIAAQN